MSEEYDPLEDLLEDDSSIQFPVNSETTPLIPATPVGAEDGIPEQTAENMICLRGPCKHYWEILQHFDNMNRGMPGDFTPKQRNRFCKLMPDTLELTGELVYDCNHWRPLSASERAERKHRQERYATENGSSSDDSE